MVVQSLDLRRETPEDMGAWNGDLMSDLPFEFFFADYVPDSMG